MAARPRGGGPPRPRGGEGSPVTFTLLSVVCLAGIAGPLLAISHRWGLPVVVGELLVGVVLGPMLLGAVHATEPTFAFLAEIGFALVMFVAGSHVPIGDSRLRAALPKGLLRAALVGVASVPLAIDPARAGRAALGALAVVGCSVALFVVLRATERRGWRRDVHRLSERRKFALELRINLAILFGLAALAQTTRVSIMLAGFTFGLAVAAIGEPRRLARQLFAVTEGFFGPLFFIWLGASLDLRALGRHPSLIGLGVALGVGALATHLVPRLLGQRPALGALACAQLGVPVAAAALGVQSHLLAAGEPTALVLGALVTIAVAAVAGTLAARNRDPAAAADSSRS